MQTIVSTTDAKTGNTQLWKFSITSPVFFHTFDLLSQYGSSNDRKLSDVAKAIQSLQNIDKFSIYAVPLSTTDPATPATNRLQHRGYENDTNPLIIRKKPLKEIQVIINHDNMLSFQNQSTLSDGTLIITQKEELQSRFFELISYFNDPKILQQIRDNERTRILQDMKENITNIREQLTNIENFQA